MGFSRSVELCNRRTNLQQFTNLKRSRNQQHSPPSAPTPTHHLLSPLENTYLLSVSVDLHVLDIGCD